MRVAIVINKSWNIYNFRMGLIRSFLAEGMEVFAIAPEDEYSKRLIEEGCKYVPLRMEEKGSNPFNDLLLIHELYKIYKKIRPDAVLHYTIKPNIYGSLAARLLNIPSINNVSGLGTVFLHNNITSKIAQNLYKISFRYPKRVFFQNKDDQELFIEKKLIKRTLTDVLPGSGININFFQPRPFKRNEVFTFLLIGRLLYDKGIVEFVNAAKALKAKGIQAKFQLLGYTDFSTKLGVKKEMLSSWVKEGIVEYLGTTDDVKNLIYESDCIVLPSYREGTPRTLLEAASLGKPLIATDVPGCKEVVDHGYNGYLCEVKNSTDLAEKMSEMFYCSDKQLIQFGINSRKKVEEKFDETIVFKKYFEVLGIKPRHLN